MEMIISLLALAGMGYAAFRGMKWMMNNGQLNAKREQPLTPNDLRVLEESAARLISDINTAADECVKRVERAVDEAERRLRTMDSNFAQMPNLHESTQVIETVTPTQAYSDTNELSTNKSSVRISHKSRMMTGELELLKGLKEIGAK